MTVVADNSAKPILNEYEKTVLDHILKLRPTQQKRIIQLCELYHDAESQGEVEDANEIAEVLSEILFGGSVGAKGTNIEDEQSADEGKSLAEHRKYVGEQIKKCRQRIRMSQDELAKKAGIPQSHVSRLEQGKHAPTYLTIEKLAKALGVRQSDLDPGFDD